MTAGQAITVLKRDSFWRVERVEGVRGACVRRVACGGRLPLSGLVARLLAHRERRALAAITGLEGVPALVRDPGLESGAPRGSLVLREWIAGRPLSRAEELPEDFFEHLDRLVAALHARGVCHNDLHKEQNILVGEDGLPYLVDFQLASVHPSRGALFASRAREDLRHVEKHRRRYTRMGRGPRGESQSGAGATYRRSWIARAWKRGAKPPYEFVTRRLLHTRDGEERRSESGPWPRWTPPLGTRRL
ncbi:MAG: phosphotransferase [Planctomycetes bacterium]|nr:phosphotransferase [Planctomycetota bacterium]